MTAIAIDDLIMPHRPDVPGLRFRRWRGFEDLVGMSAANQRARDDLGIEELIDLEGMTRTYSNLENCDLSQDLVIAERDGQTIGYVRVGWKDLTNGGREFYSFGILDPAERRQGIGQSMLSWSEGRLREIAAELAGRSARRAPCLPARLGRRRTSPLRAERLAIGRPRVRHGPAHAGRHPDDPDARRTRRAAGHRGRPAHRVGGRARGVP